MRNDSSSSVVFDTLEHRVLLSAVPTDPAYPVVELDTTYGSIFLELYTDTAPATVDNFLGYVNRGDYDGTFFHRAVIDSIPGVNDPVPGSTSSDFIIQGGAFRYDANGTSFLTPQQFPPNGLRGYTAVTTQDPVVNEFSRSNLRWTVAMAKLGDDPNSATDQFFFNLNDNSANLDNQNGGFTVFACIIAGQDVVEEMVSQRVFNVDNGLFSDLIFTESFVAPPATTEIRAQDLITINSARQVYTPEGGLTPERPAPIGGAAGSANGLVLGYASVGGGTVVIEQTGADTFSITDAGLAAESPTNANQVVAWFDSNAPLSGGGGGTRLFAATGAGLVMLSPDGQGDYDALNLSTTTGGETIASSMTRFVGIGGTVFIAGLSSDGDMLLYAGTTTTSNGATTLNWTFANLSTQDLETRGLTTPAFVGSLSSYVTPWGGLNIAGLDADGDIHTVWTSNAFNFWTTNNLSDITGAPVLTGGLSPYLTSWGGINLAGADQSGDLTTTWWVPGGEWSTFNLTASLDGPQLQASTTTTYVTSWNGLNIVGLDTEGEVIVYWWAPGQTSWTASALGAAIASDTPPTGAITGISAPGGRTSVVGINNMDEVVRYTWAPGDTWRFENLSDIAQFG